MFRDVDADFYIMADGDGTYPPDQAPNLLNVMMTANADMVIGNRMDSDSGRGSRSGHYIGNRWLVKTVNYLFDSDIHDSLSGYRILSRRFVKSIPLFSKGFEVETAMSIHAIEIDAKVIEVPISYNERYEGTESKLNTFRDGAKIGATIFNLFKDQRPKTVYGMTASLFFALGLIVGVPVIGEFFETGLVPRFPSAILARLISG